jgi:hypothetical protein
VEQTLAAMAALRGDAKVGTSTPKPASTMRSMLQSPPGLAVLWLRNRLKPSAPLTHPFNEEFQAVGAMRANLGLALLRECPKVIRNRHAEYLRGRIRQGPWGRLAEVPPIVEPAYYKVNLFAEGLAATQVEQAVDRLRRVGFWAGR